MRRTSRPIRCPNPWLPLALCLHHRATGPPNSSGSTSHLIRRRTGSHARSRFALAERLRRKTDWIHPTRVPRPCDRPGRGCTYAGILQAYARYYNDLRTAPIVGHKDAPFSRPVQRIGRIRSHAVLGGLHHQYDATLGKLRYLKCGPGCQASKSSRFDAIAPSTWICWPDKRHGGRRITPQPSQRLTPKCRPASLTAKPHPNRAGKLTEPTTAQGRSTLFALP